MRSNWLQLIDLRRNANYENTFVFISEGVSLRGYNLWLLVCSSMLASIGLDTNSAAVIIGAMLISPLMSPILGLGLSIAIHDKQLLLRSSRNLFIAVFISLFTSVSYFLITPLGLPTEEMQARTFPTLLDVLVALFGGIAGIVSISRTGPTTAIPGVAIATALMPPLCTSGFGIATGNWSFFFGAFYLFFINAVFISMATFLIVKYLHFPERKLQNRKLQRRYMLWFTLLSVVVIMPSAYFLYTVYLKAVTREKINKLVISKIRSQGNEIIKWDIHPTDSAMLVKVYHSGRSLSDSFKQAVNSSLSASGLTGYRINPMRINLTKEEVSNLSAGIARQMFAEMQIQQMTREVKSDTFAFTQVWQEVKAFLPTVDSAKNGWTTLPDKMNKIDSIPTFVYYSSARLPNKETRQVIGYLKSKFRSDTAFLYHHQRR